MGLSVFPFMEEIIESRRFVVDFYSDNLNYDKVRSFLLREHTKWNYSYYPIILDTESKLLEIQASMNDENIFPRRYFYPSLNTLEYVNSREQEVSESICKRILCLPLYAGLSEVELKKIVDKINI